LKIPNGKSGRKPKNTQYNAKRIRTNNDVQNITQKTKD